MDILQILFSPPNNINGGRSQPERRRRQKVKIHNSKIITNKQQQRVVCLINMTKVKFYFFIQSKYIFLKSTYKIYLNKLFNNLPFLNVNISLSFLHSSLAKAAQCFLFLRHPSSNGLKVGCTSVRAYKRAKKKKKNLQFKYKITLCIFTIYKIINE